MDYKFSTSSLARLLAEQIERRTTKIARYRAELRAARDGLAALGPERDVVLAGLSDRYARVCNDLAVVRPDDQAMTRRRHATEEAALRETHEAEVKALQARHRDERDELRRRHSDERAVPDPRAELRAEHADLRSAITARRAELATASHAQRTPLLNNIRSLRGAITAETDALGPIKSLARLARWRETPQALDAIAEDRERGVLPSADPTDPAFLDIEDSETLERLRSWAQSR